MTDDLDGGLAAETITYVFAGKRYEIDLSTANADTFRQIMADWISSSRLVTVPGMAPRQRTRESRENSKAVRAWAHALGLEVADRGRIPKEIVRKYENRIM